MGQFFLCDERVKSCQSLVSVSLSFGVREQTLRGQFFVCGEGKILQNCIQHVFVLENRLPRGQFFYVRKAKVMQNGRQDMYTVCPGVREQILIGLVLLCLEGNIFQNSGQSVLDLENEIVVSICEIFTEEALWSQVKRGSILGKQGKHVLDLQISLHGLRFCCGVRVWLSLVTFGLACCNCKPNPYRIASLLYFESDLFFGAC